MSVIIDVKKKNDVNFFLKIRSASILWDLTVLTEICISEATSSYFLPSMYIKRQTC